MSNNKNSRDKHTHKFHLSGNRGLNQRHGDGMGMFIFLKENDKF